MRDIFGTLFFRTEHVPGSPHVIRSPSREDLHQLGTLIVEEVFQSRLLLIQDFLLLLIFGNDTSGHEREFISPGALEDSKKRVVVFCRDRVVFVVMTLRTGHGQTQKSAARCIHAVLVKIRIGAQSIKAEASDELLHITVRQQISRDLGFDELIVRHVFIEGFNDPVAIPERIGHRLIFFRVIQLIVSVACDVEPMAPPALAVMW